MSTFAILNSVTELDAILRAVAKADEPGKLRVEHGELWVDYDLAATSTLSAKLATFSGALRRSDVMLYDLISDRMVALELN